MRSLLVLAALLCALLAHAVVIGTVLVGQPRQCKES
jgi:hypothetical protein